MCLYTQKLIGFRRKLGMLPVLRTIVTVLYILVCVALVIVIILQEGKSAGLGTISGAAETYWGKNKGRSMEGGLIRTTQVLTGVFFVLSLLLNMKW